jgi:hypothetical protein
MVRIQTRREQSNRPNPEIVDACGVTDGSLKLLVEKCKNLRKVFLPGGSLGDAVLKHFVSFCKDLTHLEVSGTKFTEDGFHHLASHPQRADKLNKLRLPDRSEDKTLSRFGVSLALSTVATHLC